MKKIIVRVILILLPVLASQRIQAQEYDINEVALMKPGNSTVGILLGASTDETIKVLGPPTSISDEYFEIGEVTAKIYTYGKNTLAFINNKLDNWDLFDSSIAVGKVNGVTFKIGDKIIIETRTVPFGPQKRTLTTRSFYRFSLQVPVARPKNHSKKTPKPPIGPVYVSHLLNGGKGTEQSMALQFDNNDQLINITLVSQ